MKIYPQNIIYNRNKHTNLVQIFVKKISQSEPYLCTKPLQKLLFDLYLLTTKYMDRIWKIFNVASYFSSSMSRYLKKHSSLGFLNLHYENLIHKIEFTIQIKVLIGLYRMKRQWKSIKSSIFNGISPKRQTIDCVR